MTEPTRTPNPGTSSHPERSSRRVAHKSPLAWLPLALLLLLLLLLALIAFAIAAANDDDGKGRRTVTAPGPSATSGPASGGGATPSGAAAPTRGAPAGGAPTAGTPTTGGAPTAGTPTTGGAPTAGTPTTGGAPSGGAPAGGTTGSGAAALRGPLKGALVGGAGLAPAAAGSTGGAAGTGGGTTATGPRAPGSAGTVLFAEGSSAIDSNGQKVIRAAAAALKAAGAHTVEVIGYTDVVAGQPVNMALSAKRGRAVAAALRTELGSGVTVTSNGRGEQDPAASNGTRKGRQQNRRAAILDRG